MVNQFYNGIHSRFKRVNLAYLKAYDHNQENKFHTHGKFCKTNRNAKTIFYKRIDESVWLD